MTCIDCEAKTRVFDTTSYSGVVYRKRVCTVCGRKFCTIEDLTDEEDKTCVNAFKMRHRRLLK